MARQTGAGIMPIHVEYSRAIRLKSWDRFMIPAPFSAVRIVCDEPVMVPAETEMETMREGIEKLMAPADKN